MEYREKWYKIALQQLSISRVVIVQGLRRIGKTQILRKISQTYEKAEVIGYTFNVFGNDDEQEMENIIEIIKNNPNKEFLLALDEFQGFIKWNELFKTIYDAYPNTKIIATGSVSHNTTSTNKTEGGRYRVINMKPLSFTEYLHIYGKINNNNFDETNFNSFATMGSYPVQEWSMGSLNQYKEQVSNNIIEKITETKLLTIAKIVKGDNVKAILKLIISTIGQTVSLYSIKKNTQVQNSTAEKILQYLKDNHIIYQINNDIKGEAKSYSLDHVYYLTDHTMYLFNESQEFKDLSEEYKGFILENIIFNKLRDLFTDKSQRLYFRKDTKRNFDIDLVVENEGKKTFYEIKKSKTGNLSKGQKAFAKDNKLNVIYFGEEKNDGNIKFINIMKLLKGEYDENF